MDHQKLKELAIKYGQWSSWAIWNEDRDKIEDTSVITKHIDKLNSNFIIVGLNMSKPKKSKVLRTDIWSNFHASYRGCRDSWLRDAFNKDYNKAKGAYMTDLIKRKDSDSKNIHKFLLTPSNSIDLEQVKTDLQNELVEIGANESTKFILIGREVQENFQSFTDSKYRKMIHLRHYSAHGIKKEQWIAEALEKIKLIE